MTSSQILNEYSAQPLSHQLLIAALKDYKRPNDKIHDWLNQGILASVKKGLYIAGPASIVDKPEPFLLANHIFGPSYISAEAALSWYGFIPERVYEITSMTVKTAREFSTPMGIFSYIHLPLPYYAFSIAQLKLSDKQFCMIASPEKALCDKIVTTSGLILRSSKMILEYLLENLRIDEQALKGVNTEIISDWIESAPKKESLKLLIKTLKSL